MFKPNSSKILRRNTLYPINLAMGTPEMTFFDTFEPGHVGIIRHLLNAGTDPNQYSIEARRRAYYSPNVPGFTPLLMAMQALVPIQTAELLLTHGADPTRVGSYQGIMPSSHQRTSNEFWDCSPLGAVLLCSGVSDTFPLDLEKIRLLLEHGAAHELAYIGKGGKYHPMPVLCRRWNHRQAADVLKLFIANGADMAAWAERAVPAVFPLIWWTEAFANRCYRTPGPTKASASICQAAATRVSAAVQSCATSSHSWPKLLLLTTVAMGRSENQPRSTLWFPRPLSVSPAPEITRRPSATCAARPCSRAPQPSSPSSCAMEPT